MSPESGDPVEHREGNKQQGDNTMMICTFHSTDRRTGGLVPAVIEATGDSIDDLVPVISDDVATELAVADENGDTLEISDHDGHVIDRSVFGVVEALAKGAYWIVLKHTRPTGETYETVFTIHTI
jgi:hypothetical protein